MFEIFSITSLTFLIHPVIFVLFQKHCASYQRVKHKSEFGFSSRAPQGTPFLFINIKEGLYED